MKYYSASTQGFYVSEIHGENIPADAVLVDDDDYERLMNGQIKQTITPDENGYPQLIDRVQADVSYAQKRRSAYPDLLEYIDAVVKGDQAGIDAYIEKCREVKRLFPKA